MTWHDIIHQLVMTLSWSEGQHPCILVIMPEPRIQVVDDHSLSQDISGGRPVGLLARLCFAHSLPSGIYSGSELSAAPPPPAANAFTLHVTLSILHCSTFVHVAWMTRNVVYSGQHNTTSPPRHT